MQRSGLVIVCFQNDIPYLKCIGFKLWESLQLRCSVSEVYVRLHFYIFPSRRFFYTFTQYFAKFFPASILLDISRNAITESFCIFMYVSLYLICIGFFVNCGNFPFFDQLAMVIYILLTFLAWLNFVIRWMWWLFKHDSVW